MGGLRLAKVSVAALHVNDHNFKQGGKKSGTLQTDIRWDEGSN